jgi:hypothetical protein
MHSAQYAPNSRCGNSLRTRPAPMPETRLYIPLPVQANCAAISTADGRWRAVSCDQSLPSACRMAAPPAAPGSAASSSGGGSASEVAADSAALPPSRRLAASAAASDAALRLGREEEEEAQQQVASGVVAGMADAASLPSPSWALSEAGSARGACPPGSSFDVPRHPLDNFRLASLLQQQGVAAAWLPITGPGWAVPGLGGTGSGAAAAEDA